MMNGQRVLRCGGSEFRWGTKTYVMGIINTSPESFSGDGKTNIEATLAQARWFIAEGADILDVGGESTRPGLAGISAEEELARVIPVVEAIARETNIAMSIDTMKPVVAEAALKAGATILNDQWGLRKEPALADLAVRYDVPIILMSNQRDRGSYDKDAGRDQVGRRDRGDDIREDFAEAAPVEPVGRRGEAEQHLRGEVIEQTRIRRRGGVVELVHDHHVGGQRVVLIAPEAEPTRAAGAEFQQAVNVDRLAHPQPKAQAHLDQRIPQWLVNVQRRALLIARLEVQVAQGGNDRTIHQLAQPQNAAQRHRPGGQPQIVAQQIVQIAHQLQRGLVVQVGRADGVIGAAGALAGQRRHALVNVAGDMPGDGDAVLGRASGAARRRPGLPLPDQFHQAAKTAIVLSQHPRSTFA